LINELMIQLNYKCSLKCIHCAYGDLDIEDEISLEQVEQFLDKYPNATLIKLSGGEPTMASNFEDVVRLCKSKCHNARITCFTNGLSRKKYNIEPHYYWVSLYGNKEIHNSITRADTYDKTIEFIIANYPWIEYFNSPLFSLEQMKSLKEISIKMNIPLRITQLLSHGRSKDVLSTEEQRRIIYELDLHKPPNWVTCSLGFEAPRCKKKICLKPDGNTVLCTYIIRGLKCPFMGR